MEDFRRASHNYSDLVTYNFIIIVKDFNLHTKFNLTALFLWKWIGLSFRLRYICTYVVSMISTPLHINGITSECYIL